jgi:hypothetical protein
MRKQISSNSLQNSNLALLIIVFTFKDVINIYKNKSNDYFSKEFRNTSPLSSQHAKIFVSIRSLHRSSHHNRQATLKTERPTGETLDVRKGNYIRHMKTTHGGERFHCVRCSISYNRKDNLLAHSRRLYPELGVPPARRRK